MAVQTYRGGFITPTVLASTLAITGIPFAPQAIIFWWSDFATDADAYATSADCVWGMAFATGPAARYQITNRKAGGTGSKSGGDDCIFHPCGESGGPSNLGRLDIQSFDANGFTVVVDTAISDTTYIHFLAIGGYSHVKCGLITLDAGATPRDQSIAGVGFQPCLVMAMGCSEWAASWDAANGAYPGTCLDVAAATDATHQGGITTNYNGSVAAYGYYGRADEWIVDDRDSNNPGPYIRTTFKTMDVDGFTFTILEGGQAELFPYLAFGGPDGTAYVGNTQTRTDGLDIAVSTGFRPSGVFQFSHCRALQNPDTHATGSCSISLGAESSEASRSAIGVMQPGVYVAQNSAEMFEKTKNGATDGYMDVKSVDNTGITAVMDQVDSIASTFFYVAFGPASFESRKRAVTYTRDTMDPDPRLKDANNFYVDPWECHADAWVKFLSVFTPTSVVPASLVDDPEAGYIEEIGWSSESDAPKIFTSRMDLGETILAQAASKSGS